MQAALLERVADMEERVGQTPTLVPVWAHQGGLDITTTPLGTRIASVIENDERLEALRQELTPLQHGMAQAVFMDGIVRFKYGEISGRDVVRSTRFGTPPVYRIDHMSGITVFFSRPNGLMEDSVFVEVAECRSERAGEVLEALTPYGYIYPVNGASEPSPIVA